MAFNCGIQSPIKIYIRILEILQKFQNEYLRIIVNASWYVTNDTLHNDFNVSYFRDKIRRLSQRYIDRLENSNVFTTNLMRNAKTSRRLKRSKIYAPDRIIILWGIHSPRPSRT